MEPVRFGVIGGTGLYQMENLEVIEEVEVETPFGKPSDALTVGRIHDVEVAFLPRHGRGHRILPSELNFRANIWALKKLGVETVVSVSAVGSMREDVEPKHLLIPDQFIDRTRHRVDTFFGDGLVAHIGFADPVCNDLGRLLGDASEAAGATVHRGGTYLCMEGPQFSTRAESRMYRTWGVDVIGMTNLQEAKLAREAELCYATIALVTDYDCWHEGEEDVDGAAVLEVLRQNGALAQSVLSEALRRLAGGAHERSCGCPNALATALVTPRDLIPETTYRRVELLVGRYLDPAP